MKKNSLIFFVKFIYLPLFLTLLNITHTIKSKLIKFNTYLPWDNSCKISTQKHLCEFTNLFERNLVDCLKCGGEETNCENCFSYNNKCYEMQIGEKYSYEHNGVIYKIQTAKLKSQIRKNEYKEIIEVNELNGEKNFKKKSEDLKSNAVCLMNYSKTRAMIRVYR